MIRARHDEMKGSARDFGRAPAPFDGSGAR
jgi:hypothetical protein